MSSHIDQDALDRLRNNFSGEVLLPVHPEYDSNRKIFNAMIDRRPSVIARCAGVEDVARAVSFGRDQELEISVHSGGHHVAGWSVTDGGLMIDMRNMNKVVIDPDARIAYIGGGAIWAEVDRACQPFDLTTTGGAVSTLGVAGFILGGGKGWLQGKYGYGCDNLIEVELVTAEGKTINASEKVHPELFWALHGGGGNFGVATAFTLKLHPLQRATLANLIFSPEVGPKVIRRYRDVIESGIPRELNMYISYLTGPPDDYVPKHLANSLCMNLGAFYPGSEEKMLRVIAPILELGPEGKIIVEKSYAAIQGSLDSDLGELGNRVYSSAEHLLSFPDEAIDKFCSRAHDMVVPSHSSQELLAWGRAAADMKGDWPIAHLEAPWAVSPFGQWTDPADDERGIAWARALCDDMKPYAGGGGYLNASVDEGRGRIIAGYGGKASYDRLARVKAKYDPDNIFHLNHNIEPG
jgi:FAD/FMN-containing dehydrogenase